MAVADSIQLLVALQQYDHQEMFIVVKEIQETATTIAETLTTTPHEATILTLLQEAMRQQEAAALLLVHHHAAAVEVALEADAQVAAVAVALAVAVEAVEDNTIQGPHVTFKEHGDFLAKNQCYEKIFTFCSLLSFYRYYASSANTKYCRKRSTLHYR